MMGWFCSSKLSTAHLRMPLREDWGGRGRSEIPLRRPAGLIEVEVARLGFTDTAKCT